MNRLIFGMLSRLLNTGMDSFFFLVEIELMDRYKRRPRRGTEDKKRDIPNYIANKHHTRLRELDYDN